MKINKFSSIIIALILISSNAIAESSQANFQSTASLTAICNVNVSNTLLSENNENQIKYLVIKCSKNLNYSIGLSTGSSGDFTQRQMVGSNLGGKINYNIYTSETKDQILGDGTNGTKLLNGIATGTDDLIAFFIGYPSNQYAIPDSYLDVITITVTY